MGVNDCKHGVFKFADCTECDADIQDCIEYADMMQKAYKEREKDENKD